MSKRQKLSKSMTEEQFDNGYSDFFGSEKNSTRTQAMKAWRELKTLDIPKTYQAWKKYHE